MKNNGTRSADILLVAKSITDEISEIVELTGRVMEEYSYVNKKCKEANELVAKALDMHRDGMLDSSIDLLQRAAAEISTLKFRSQIHKAGQQRVYPPNGYKLLMPYEKIESDMIALTPRGWINVGREIFGMVGMKVEDTNFFVAKKEEGGDGSE